MFFNYNEVIINIDDSNVDKIELVYEEIESWLVTTVIAQSWFVKIRRKDKKWWEKDIRIRVYTSENGQMLIKEINDNLKGIKL